MDTEASASVISLKILNENFPDLDKQIQPAGFSLFAANQLKLHIEGTIVLQLEIGSLKVQCSFVVIAESLSYAIIGFDLILTQNIFLHPEGAIFQLE